MTTTTTPRAPTIDNSGEGVKSIEAMNDVPGMMRLSHIVLFMILPAIPAVMLALTQYYMGTSTIFYVLWAGLGVIALADWAWLSTHMMTRVRNTRTQTRIAGGIFLAWGMLLVNVSLAFTAVVLLAGGKEMVVLLARSIADSLGGA